MASETVKKLHEAALAFSSQLPGSNEPLAELLEEAADEIELLEEAEMRWISRIYEIRKALGVGAEKAMLDELAAEVAKVRAADRDEGRRAALDALRDEGMEIATKADLSDMRDALIAAHRFVQEERENRESAGGDMTDYVGEARAVEDLIAGALGIVEPEAAPCPLPTPPEGEE